MVYRQKAIWGHWFLFNGFQEDWETVWIYQLSQVGFSWFLEGS